MRPLRSFRMHGKGYLFNLLKEWLLSLVVLCTKCFGSLKQHMFKQVGNTTFISVFMDTPHAVSNPGSNGWRTMSLNNQHRQTIRKMVFLHYFLKCCRMNRHRQHHDIHQRDNKTNEPFHTTSLSKTGKSEYSVTGCGVHPPKAY